MDIILGPLLYIIQIVVRLYIWVVILSAILSWLVHFNVVNPRNQFVYTLLTITWRLTEPALRPIRRILPSMSGVDLSPMVLILALIFLQNMLARLAVNLGVY